MLIVLHPPKFSHLARNFICLMLRFEIKAIIADENKIVRHDTIYLFNKEKKLLLPIKINDSETKNLLLAYDSRMQHRPTIHDTAKRLISALRGQIDKENGGAP